MSEKNWHSGYDDLFGAKKPLKPAPKPTPRAKAAEPATPAAKPKSQAKRSAPARKPTGKSNTGWIWLVVIIVAIGGYMLNTGKEGTSSHHSSADSSTSTAVLQDAGLKRTSKVDSSYPLSLKRTGQVLTFNRGYQLTVSDDLNMAVSKSQSAVLPQTKYADYFTAVDFDSNDRDDRTYFMPHLRLYGDLIEDFSQYWETGGGAYVKAFPQANVGQVRTGYVVHYPKKGDYADFAQYFLWPDGAGFTIELSGDEWTGAKLTKSDNWTKQAKGFSKYLKWYQAHFTFTQVQPTAQAQSSNSASSSSAASSSSK